MAHFDESTREFMDKLAGKKDDQKLDAAEAADVARTAFSAVKGLSDPHKRGQYVARTLTGETLKSLLGSEKKASTSALKIFEIMNDAYGTRWHDWEPETVWTTLVREHTIEPDETLKNVIQALQVTCKTNYPFEMWHVFEKVGHAFNGNLIDFDVVQPLELDEIALTVKILRAIRPKEEFSDEIAGYTAASAQLCGVVKLPSDLFPEASQAALGRLGNDAELYNAVTQLQMTPPEKIKDETVRIQLERLKEIREYAQNA